MKQYGFTSQLAKVADQYKEYIVGRILSQEKDFYRVICEKGEVLAGVSGKFRFEAKTVSDFPAVGDFVLLDNNSSQGGNAVIHHVLPRKSIFTRKAAGTAYEEQVIAANIDTIFICMSLNNDFNIRRLERYLSVTWESGAIPVVVLTKADLCDDIDNKLALVTSVAMGVDVLITNSMKSDGYNQILRYIKEGQTVALIGSSGVGKTTMMNYLIGSEQLRTNGLRNDDKGRHTTTRRELILLHTGGMVIDTPGIRELGIWDISDGLGKSFSDIEELSTHCRFHDCNHMGEPGCAVRAAIENGELSEERWFSYQKLKTEAVYMDDKVSYLAAKEKKFKNIAKVNKIGRKSNKVK